MSEGFKKNGRGKPEGSEHDRPVPPTEGMVFVALLVVILFLGMLVQSGVSLGHTVVTTYVTQVQDERQQTRFTLTEWLRIKERMRMMDVWLALFSEPKKDKFKPELSLTYFRNKSLFQNRPDSHFDGSSTRAQVWLTNLISSQVGIRTLNIDLGGEFQREEHTLRGGLEPSVLGESNSRRGSSSIVTVGSWSPASQTSVGPTLTAGGGGKSRLQSFMGNLRLFGKHIQDSALVIKYGEYRYQGFDPTGVELRAPISQRGPLLGAELTLYVSSWLGLSGQYQSLGLEPSGVRQGLLSGSLAEGQAFIEVSILRLVAGSFVRQWASRGAQKNEEARAGPDTKQTGAFTGLQLQL